MPRLSDTPILSERPPNVSPGHSMVPANCTPIGSNPFVRVHTPVARLGANVSIPNAIAPGQRR